MEFFGIFKGGFESARVDEPSVVGSLRFCFIWFLALGKNTKQKKIRMCV